MLAQLHALRAQVDALIALVESELPRPVEAVEPDVCPHPQEKRIDASTFGGRRFKCLQCGQIIEGPM